MTNIAHWNPFRNLSRFEPAASFDDLFRGLRLSPAWRDMENATPEVRLDVSEDDKGYRIKAEIPGVDKNDIEVSVEGNQVAISAEVKRETRKKEGEKDIYTERYYGKVYRAFSLPSDLDSSKADAHYDAGVLTLTIPKKSNGGAKRISVN